MKYFTNIFKLDSILIRVYLSKILICFTRKSDLIVRQQATKKH